MRAAPRSHETRIGQPARGAAARQERSYRRHRARLSSASLRVRSWPSSDEAGREQGAESSFPLCDALARPENALPILEAELAAVRASLA